ncbi:MAG TPA: histidine phosphatase family protein [Polyangiaceae bacterium]|nr:histidine phosphatase family protein [Polyangiaceae bacterium]
MGAIYLIRHGQASFAAADYDDLSPLGREQARVLGFALAARGVAAQRAICGGLRRHQQTADECLAALARGQGAEEQVARAAVRSWEEDRGWDEYDHNEVLAGLDPRYKSQAALAAEVAAHEHPKRAFQGMFERAMARWLDGAFHGEYRESWPAFCARVEDALARLVARLGRSESALVFTSGGVISVICRKLLELGDTRTLSLSASLANASVTKLLLGERGVTLSTLNEHAHFEREGKRLITYR